MRYGHSLSRTWPSRWTGTSKYRPTRSRLLAATRRSLASDGFDVLRRFENTLLHVVTHIWAAFDGTCNLALGSWHTNTGYICGVGTVWPKPWRMVNTNWNPPNSKALSKCFVVRRCVGNPGACEAHLYHPCFVPLHEFGECCPDI